MFSIFRHVVRPWGLQAWPSWGQGCREPCEATSTPEMISWPEALWPMPMGPCCIGPPAATGERASKVVLSQKKNNFPQSPPRSQYSEHTCFIYMEYNKLYWEDSIKGASKWTLKHSFKYLQRFQSQLMEIPANLFFRSRFDFDLTHQGLKEFFSSSDFHEKFINYSLGLLEFRSVGILLNIFIRYWLKYSNFWIFGFFNSVPVHLFYEVCQFFLQ